MIKKEKTNITSKSDTFLEQRNWKLLLLWIPLLFFFGIFMMWAGFNQAGIGLTSGDRYEELSTSIERSGGNFTITKTYSVTPEGQAQLEDLFFIIFFNLLGIAAPISAIYLFFNTAPRRTIGFSKEGVTVNCGWPINTQEFYSWNSIRYATINTRVLSTSLYKQSNNKTLLIWGADREPSAKIRLSKFKKEDSKEILNIFLKKLTTIKEYVEETAPKGGGYQGRKHVIVHRVQNR